MNSHHALAAVEQFVSDVNLGRMESARAFFSPEFFNHIPEKGEPTATEVFSGILADIKGALPDLRGSAAGPQHSLRGGRAQGPAVHRADPSIPWALPCARRAFVAAGRCWA